MSGIRDPVAVALKGLRAGVWRRAEGHASDGLRWRILETCRCTEGQDRYGLPSHFARVTIRGKCHGRRCSKACATSAGMQEIHDQMLAQIADVGRWYTAGRRDATVGAKVGANVRSGLAISGDGQPESPQVVATNGGLGLPLATSRS